MADAPDTATFVTTSDEQSTLPNSRELYADPLVDQFQFDIESQRIHLKPTRTLLSITEMPSSGFMKFDSVSKNISPKVYLESDTIEFDEDSTSISFLVKDFSSIQNIGFFLNGVAKSTKPAINFKAGANVAITVNAQSGYNDVTISASSALSQISGTGIVTTNGSALTGRLITSTDNTVDITNPGGIAGNIDLSVPGVSGSEATFFVQDDTDLPPNAIDLSQPGARMGIGLGSPTCSIDILSADSENVLNGVTDTTGGGIGGITLTNYGNSTAQCSLLLQGSRGSIGDDPEDQQIQSGDVIGSVRARGMDNEGGFGSNDNGAIKFIAAQNFTNSAKGTKVSFFTTPNGSTTPVEAGNFSNAGVLNATYGITSNAGLVVTAGATVLGAALTATGGAITLGATTTTTLGASGLITASAGLTSTAGATTLGATATTTLASSGLITASAGLTSTAGATTLGATTTTTLGASGLVTGTAGLSITRSTTIATNDYTAGVFLSQTAGSGSDFGGIKATTYQGGSSLGLRRANGASGTTAVGSSQQIGAIDFFGYDGTAYFNSASISTSTSQLFSGTQHGTNIEFYTTNDTASAILTKRMELSYRGYLGLNKATPDYRMEVYNDTTFTTNDYTAASIVSNTASAGSDFGGMRVETRGGPTKFRIARVNAASGAVQVGQDIGEYNFEGYTGAAFNAGARILASTTQTWTSNNNGTYVRFFTTPNNSNTPVECLRLNQDGNVLIPISLTATVGTSAFSAVTANSLTIVASGSTPLDTTSNTTSASAGGPIVTNYGGAGGANAALLLRGSRGTSGTPLAVQSGDIISAIRSQGMNDAGSFGSGANGAIRFVAEENFVSTTNKGTSIVFFTTPTGAGTAGQSMVIRNGSSTEVAIGLNPTSGRTLEVYDNEVYTLSSLSWKTGSDIRIKRDIVDTESALPIFQALQPRKYKYTPEHVAHVQRYDNSGNPLPNPLAGDAVFYGLIADEVELVMPSCVEVSQGKSGDVENIKVLNAHNLTIMSFKAIKELIALNAALEARIAALEAA